MSPASTTQPVLLVVEDEPTLRSLLSMELAAEGYHVVEAENATAALEALSKHRVDLVLSDLRMPNGDGLGLLTRLRESPFLPKPLFLLMTGGDPETIAEAQALGADGLFRKPFEWTELHAKISSLIRERAAVAAQCG